MHLTRDFSHAPCTCDHTHIVAQGVSVRISLHPHAIHDVTCLSVRLLSLRVLHLTRDFSHAPCTCDHTHIVAQGVSVRIFTPSTCHP